MYAALRHSLAHWLFRLRGPESGRIVLVQRRVFILPSRYGIAYAGVLLLMLAGSANYNIALGFALTFLLTALGFNSLLYTYRNLAQLAVIGGRAQPVHAGGTAHFSLTIENPGAVTRYGIGIARDGVHLAYVDIPAGNAVTVAIAVPALRRGVLLPGRLMLYTRYPLGLCYAWAYVEPKIHCLVYPKAEAGAPPLPPAANGTQHGAAPGPEQDDFSGLRAYHPGDAPRRIAWKAAARGGELLTKQFSGASASELWIDWAHTPQALGVEGRLSRLARWIVDAQASGQRFGLRLPGGSIALATGSAQRERCLEALALFEADR